MDSKAADAAPSLIVMLAEKTTSFTHATVLLAIMFSATAGVRSHAAQSLSRVRKLYVDSFGSAARADEMRARFADRLRRDHAVAIVPDAGQADAVVKGMGEVWVAGHFYPNPRSKSFRQESYSGYLAVEVLGRSGETLWSYLVTPSRLSPNVVRGLADEAAARLLEALMQADLPRAAASGLSASAEGSLTGAGATFPAPLYQLWIESFERTQPQTHITYEAIGSEAGIERLGDGRAEFAASDMPLPDARLAAFGRKVAQVPSVLGAVVPIYNVENLDRDLNFTADVLAGIYLGSITKWNDPHIKASNPGASLPEAEIVVVHRSDGSGTSFVWTDYLSKVSASWKASVGAGLTPRWPVGVGAEHNEGVAALVQKTPNSLGYVELIYAIQHQLSYGAVQNRSGRFIKADLPSVSAAAVNLPVGPSTDLRVSITDSEGKAAYPIASFTWLLLPMDTKDAGKKTTLLALVRWFLTSGQRQCSMLGYAPLPSAVAKRSLQIIGDTP